MRESGAAKEADVARMRTLRNNCWTEAPSKQVQVDAIHVLCDRLCLFDHGEASS